MYIQKQTVKAIVNLLCYAKFDDWQHDFQRNDVLSELKAQGFTLKEMLELISDNKTA